MVVTPVVIIPINTILLVCAAKAAHYPADLMSTLENDWTEALNEYLPPSPSSPVPLPPPSSLPNINCSGGDGGNVEQLSPASITTFSLISSRWKLNPDSISQTISLSYSIDKWAKCDCGSERLALARLVLLLRRHPPLSTPSNHRYCCHHHCLSSLPSQSNTPTPAYVLTCALYVLTLCLCVGKWSQIYQDCLVAARQNQGHARMIVRELILEQCGCQWWWAWSGGEELTSSQSLYDIGTPQDL